MPGILSRSNKMSIRKLGCGHIKQDGYLCNFETKENILILCSIALIGSDLEQGSAGSRDSVKQLAV